MKKLTFLGIALAISSLFCVKAQTDINIEEYYIKHLNLS